MGQRNPASPCMVKKPQQNIGMSLAHNILRMIPDEPLWPSIEGEIPPNPVRAFYAGNEFGTRKKWWIWDTKNISHCEI